MDATFTFAVDGDRRLIESRLAGFFTPESFHRYVAARRAAFAQLSGEACDSASVVDLTDMKIQQQDLVAAFSAMMADRSLRSRRLAFIINSPLARLQLRRALGERYGRDALAFEDAETARHWALTGETSTEAA